MRNAGADQRFVEVAARRHPQAAVVEPAAAALFGPEGLVGQRLVDQRMGDFGLPVGLLLLDRDRDGEVRDAVEEIGGPIQRIDDEARLGRIAGDLAAFLEQEVPVRTRGLEFAEIVSSACLSAMVTKSPGPFLET